MTFIERLEQLVLDFRQTPEDLKVRNLKYEIQGLERLQKLATDPVIKREIQKRIRSKRKSLLAAEVAASKKFKAQVEKAIDEEFQELVKSTAARVSVEVKE